MSEVKIIRNSQLVEKLIVVNGFPGCGKTMLSPIVSSFDKVEIMQYSETIEQISELYFLKKISEDTAQSMIKIHVDRLLYKAYMGRDINCRPSDLSSIFRNKPFKYIYRMLSKGDELIPQKIKNNKPTLNLTTHMLYPNIQLFSEVFGKKMIFIEVVRNPLYMIIQKEKNFKMYKENRSGHINYEYDSKEYIFFAKGWEKKFDELNTFEKAIYSIKWYFDYIYKYQKEDVLIIPFEKFVINPNNFIDAIAEKLESHVNKDVKKMMKLQKVPRKYINDGPSLDIYKRCGWEPPKYYDEDLEFEARRKLIKEKISIESLSVLDEMIRKYRFTF